MAEIRYLKMLTRTILLFGWALPVLAGATSQEPSHLIYSLKGRDLFRSYCATCHGSNGKGGGPVSPALITRPPDLSLLSKRNGGQFPSARARSIIAGDEVLASHGSRQMPIWGPIFHQVEEDRDYGNVRMENLVKYLQSIQSIVTLPSGADLYRQDCSVCHGNDLKGGGSVPSPYRVPPDLTTLAQRHGGKFPGSYVSDILRNGVALPAHGPAEMPVWGADFRFVDQLDESEIRSRIAALTGYIESHQKK